MFSCRSILKILREKPECPIAQINLCMRNIFLDHDFSCRVLEGTNLLVSSGTASAIAGDRLCLVTRKTARHNDTKVQYNMLKEHSFRAQLSRESCPPRKHPAQTGSHDQTCLFRWINE